MDIRELAPGFAVSPQLEPAHMRALAEQGYRTVICNRPDMEVPPHLSMAEMRGAAEAAGLSFIENPMAGGINPEMIALQGDGAAPVLAYCASGMRSAALWALSQAGTRPVDEILDATAMAGYALDGLAPQIAALAANKSSG